LVLLGSKAMAFKLVALVAAVVVWASHLVVELICEHWYHDGLVLVQVHDVEWTVMISVDFVVRV
jgi:hypothetical protein